MPHYSTKLQHVNNFLQFNQTAEYKLHREYRPVGTRIIREVFRRMCKENSVLVRLTYVESGIPECERTFRRQVAKLIERKVLKKVNVSKSTPNRSIKFINVCYYSLNVKQIREDTNVNLINVKLEEKCTSFNVESDILSCSLNKYINNNKLQSNIENIQDDLKNVYGGNKCLKTNNISQSVTKTILKNSTLTASNSKISQTKTDRESSNQLEVNNSGNSESLSNVNEIKKKWFYVIWKQLRTEIPKKLLSHVPPEVINRCGDKPPAFWSAQYPWAAQHAERAFMALQNFDSQMGYDISLMVDSMIYYYTKMWGNKRNGDTIFLKNLKFVSMISQTKIHTDSKLCNLEHYKAVFDSVSWENL